MMDGLLLGIAVAVFTGVNPGFASIGLQAYSQEFEYEASYVSLYLVEHAGYDINNAPTSGEE